MKGQRKDILTLMVAAVLVGNGIVFINPSAVKGQPKERVVLSQESTRDPFLLPSGVRLLSKGGAALGTRTGTSAAGNRPTEDPMKVKAILISDHARLVLIDRYIVTVGDWIRGEKVLDIRPDRVTLGKGEQKRTLLLSQSPVMLTVDEPKGENK